MLDSKSEWRCQKCQTLLGLQQDDRLYVRFRKMQYVLVGSQDTVIATCGVCGRTDERPAELLQRETVG
jgi:RNase P subunit RPR2